jgi:hypothetical protein
MMLRSIVDCPRSGRRSPTPPLQIKDADTSNGDYNSTTDDTTYNCACI